MPRRRAVPTKQEVPKPPEPASATNAHVAAGWTLPPRPKEWGAIDLGAIAATLPAPGLYPGTIGEVRLTDRVDVLWLTVYGRGPSPPPTWPPSPPTQARRTRVACATAPGCFTASRRRPAQTSEGGEPRRHPCPVRGQAGGPQAGAQGQGWRARACRPRDPPAGRPMFASLAPLSARWDGWRQSR